jgi:hypothetical protein
MASAASAASGTKLPRNLVGGDEPDVIHATEALSQSTTCSRAVDGDRSLDARECEEMRRNVLALCHGPRPGACGFSRSVSQAQARSRYAALVVEHKVDVEQHQGLDGPSSVSSLSATLLKSMPSPRSCDY